MKKYLVLLIAVLALSGCGSNTSIVNSWRDPKITVAQEHFKKVLVVALVKDEASRRVAENVRRRKLIYAYLKIKNTRIPFPIKLSDLITIDKLIKWLVAKS